MHYFEWNIKSYQAATSHLTNAEDLAYRRLLEHYYDTEQPIPTALPPLCRRLRVGLPELEIVLNEFFELVGDVWVHRYCDTVIEQYNSYISRQQANGRKGGRGIKADAKPDKPTANPPLTQCQTNQQTTNQQTTNQDKSKAMVAAKATTPLAKLIELGVDAQVAADWLTVRKAKRAPLTDTALTSLSTEARKAGISVAQAVAICAKKNWQGFNASWDWQDNGMMRGSSSHDAQMDCAKQIFGGMNATNRQIIDITDFGAAQGNGARISENGGIIGQPAFLEMERLRYDDGL